MQHLYFFSPQPLGFLFFCLSFTYSSTTNERFRIPLFLTINLTCLQSLKKTATCARWLLLYSYHLRGEIKGRMKIFSYPHSNSFWVETMSTYLDCVNCEYRFSLLRILRITMKENCNNAIWMHGYVQQGLRFGVGRYCATTASLQFHSVAPMYLEFIKPQNWKERFCCRIVLYLLSWTSAEDDSK